MSRSPACSPSGAGETTSSRSSLSRLLTYSSARRTRSASRCLSDLFIGPTFGEGRILPDGNAEIREISEDHKILRMSRLAVHASPRKSPSDGRDRGDGRPGSPGAAGLVGVFLLTVALRLAVSSDLSSLVLWTDPQLDARENLVWASALAQGD